MALRCWRRTLLFAFIVTTTSAGRAAVEPRCATCHAEIAAKYRSTGMGRSFFKPSPANTIEDYSKSNHYFHAASRIHYAMVLRDGVYYQQRYQTGLNGAKINAYEERIDFVLGSGTHARTYLHRTEQGTLVQLPLAWYAEKGGYWAMSPGYDAPDHPGSTRPIGNDCMFCHNAYPSNRTASDHFGDVPVFEPDLPHGIDCERCHGPAKNHAVNPAKFTPERSMEVCMQCHLQPDSFRPTLNFKRYNRAWFSYKPGEPLSDFMLFFDTEPSDPDRFHIAGTAYEFRKSACFLKSSGKLQCTTCHNPHEVQHGSQAAAQYNAVCGTCHVQLPSSHNALPDCVSCHMPKRRTTDVVHVVMTDHYIRRARLKGDLLAEMPERHGATASNSRVKPYYPAQLRDPLYLPVARLRNGESTGEVMSAIRAKRPRIPDVWFEIAEEEHRANRLTQAVEAYRSALALAPNYLPALMGLGAAQRESHHPELAAATYARALKQWPRDARIWNALGQTQIDLKNPMEAAESLSKSAMLDPAMPNPHVWLGVLHAQSGRAKEAEEEFRAALRLQPNHAQAHANLAILLALEGNLPLAWTEFDAAVTSSPSDPSIRISYAALLNQGGQAAAARVQLEAALQWNPQFAPAHDMLGNLLERAGEPDKALKHYQEAVRIQPGDWKSQFDLGAIMRSQGDLLARSHISGKPQPRPIRTFGQQPWSS